MQAIEHDVDHATCHVPVKSMPRRTDSGREHVGLGTPVQDANRTRAKNPVMTGRGNRAAIRTPRRKLAAIIMASAFAALSIYFGWQGSRVTSVLSFVAAAYAPSIAGTKVTVAWSKKADLQARRRAGLLARKDSQPTGWAEAPAADDGRLAGSSF